MNEVCTDSNKDDSGNQSKYRTDSVRLFTLCLSPSKNQKRPFDITQGQGSACGGDKTAGKSITSLPYKRGIIYARRLFSGK